MVHRTYAGLGGPDAAIREFTNLGPYYIQMLELRAECIPESPDHAAMSVPLKALTTAAFHFTKRREFYHVIEAEFRDQRRDAPKATNSRLSDRQEALKAFLTLAPYAAALRSLQDRVRPFGIDYQALAVARHGLDVAALHFTGEASLYGARGDSAGPTRPRL